MMSISKFLTLLAILAVFSELVVGARERVRQCDRECKSKKGDVNKCCGSGKLAQYYKNTNAICEPHTEAKCLWKNGSASSLIAACDDKCNTDQLNACCKAVKQPLMADTGHSCQDAKYAMCDKK